MGLRKLAIAALSSGAAASAMLVAGDARAASAFVDAPLTLPPLKVSADAGVGLGTFQNYQPDPNNLQRSILVGGNQVGWGTSLEAAIGLPVVGELGVRIAYRFGPDVTIDAASGATRPAGVLARADHFARLFDPIVSEPGVDAFSNPEVRLRGSLFDLQSVQLGLESRLIIPTASGAVFGVTPGIPLRVHVPGLLRVDTGLWLPMAFLASVAYSLELPAQAFFQVNGAFFGPVTGLRYNIPNLPGVDNTVDVPLGVAGGYTFLAGPLALDVKAQVRTDRINDVNWATQHLGAGLGLGLRTP
jgi:hypothetical protein